jgi:MipA family protein
MHRLSRCSYPVLLAWVAPVLVLALPQIVRAQSVAGQFMQQQALEQQGLAGEKAASGWSVTVGGGVASVPKYPGASGRRVRFAPLVSILYDNRIFLGPLGVGAVAVRWRGFRAGPIIGLQGGREQSDDPHLTGLGDISTSITGGAFADYRVGFLAVSAVVRQALSHKENGLSGLIQLNVHHSIWGKRASFMVGPDAEFGNSDFLHTWFGISQAQSASSGLPIYATHAGIVSAGLHAGFTYRATRHWLLRAFTGVSRLTGAAAESPIVERRTQVLAGAGIAYHF